jgi:hypothetical protein
MLFVRFYIYAAMTVLLMFLGVKSPCVLVGRRERFMLFPSSALKMETVCFSETLTSTNESTW